MLYTLYGEQSNGKIVMPATKQQIVDYCLTNPDIANAISEVVEKNRYSSWKEEVLKEFTSITGFSPEDIEGIDDELSSLDNSGITNIAQAANELASELIKSNGSSLSVKPTYRGCVACTMLGKGVKFRKSPTHTCGK